MFLLALLLVRRLPAALYRSTIARRGAVAAALLQATSLPFLVTAVAMGLELGVHTGDGRRPGVGGPAVGDRLPDRLAGPAADGAAGER
jgi:hypothetical protein